MLGHLVYTGHAGTPEQGASPAVALAAPVAASRRRAPNWFDRLIAQLLHRR